jgi:hypothetical protein
MATKTGRIKSSLLWIAAAAVLAAPGVHAQAQKQRTTDDALKDPDAQPSQSTPRPPKPNKGPNRTSDALQDAESQPSQGTPKPPKPNKGPNRTGDALNDPDAQPGQGTPRR